MIFFFVSILALFGCANAQCLCNVEKNGEYCGVDLNSINGNKNCGRNFYYCGNSNRNKTAVLIRPCSQDKPCDLIRDKVSACAELNKCRCSGSLFRRINRSYCGSQLKGCGKDVIYKCSPGRPKPKDACPYGCNNGKCVGGPNSEPNSEPTPEPVPPELEPESESESESQPESEPTSEPETESESKSEPEPKPDGSAGTS